MENEFLLSEAQAMAPLVRAILRDSVEAYAFAQFCQRRAESLFSRRRAPD
jgi:hypothetical protein